MKIEIEISEFIEDKKEKSVKFKLKSMKKTICIVKKFLV
jgi:hypothetical protein